MIDPSFFTPARPITVGEIAELTGAQLQDSADSERIVQTISSIHDAAEDSLVFAEKGVSRQLITGLKAAAILCTPELAALVPPEVVRITTESPRRAFAKVGRELYPESNHPPSVAGRGGVSEHAIIHEDVEIEADVTIEAGAVIGRGVAIGRGSVIGPNAVIGVGCKIGRDCHIASGCGIKATLIGDRVIIHGGTQIGHDGFGFVPGDRGAEKIPQLGRVIIQDNVEIGANVTIDRGTLSDTVIGEGTKIDNQVQIGHNVRIGRHCLIAGQCGVSGTVTIGDHVMLGGQTGIADHVTIGSGVSLAAQSGVVSNIKSGGTWAGAPARPIKELFKTEMALRRLTRQKHTRGDSDG